MVESKTMDTSADTVIAHTPTITSTTAMSVWRRELMRKNCELCGFDLTGEGIKDLIPLCHTCYVDKNPQVIKYLAELKELGKDNV